MPARPKTPTQPANLPSAGESLEQNPGSKQTASLGAFVVQPTQMHFATQSPQEQILLVLRRHPITQVGWIFFGAILIVLPIIFYPVIATTFVELAIPPSYQLVMISFWYLATFAFILTNFVLWYFNVNIITTRRVLDIDFPSLLIQEVTGTHIEQIEDVTYQRIGVLATLADFGNVFVQTAGAQPNIEFLQVPRPRQVVRVILDLMGKVSNGSD
jgi:hypothetical protein